MHSLPRRVDLPGLGKWAQDCGLERHVRLGVRVSGAVSATDDPVRFLEHALISIDAVFAHGCPLNTVPWYSVFTLQAF